MLCRFMVLAVLCLLPGALPDAQAMDDDSRFLLERLRQVIDHRGQLPAEPAAPPGQIRHEGQLYSVGDDKNELEAAIYIAVNSAQWERLVEFITRYRVLPDHRPALPAMAEALLARQAGDLHGALRRMLVAHEHEPGDLRITLEMARLQFENNQDRDARASINQLLAGELPPHTRGMLDQYMYAFDQRSAWHGSMALGVGRNSNINQANGDYTCLLRISDHCVFERRMPTARPSNLLNYDLALQRRVPLGGHHNLQFRAIGYGSQFHERVNTPGALSNPASHAATVHAGYQYLDAQNSFNVSSYLEYLIRGGRGEYRAPGLQLEWRRAIGTSWQIGSQLDAKHHQHTGWGRSRSGDYTQYQWGVSANYAPSAGTYLYGGLDLGRRKYTLAQASTREATIRTGVFHTFPGDTGIYVNAQGLFRLSRADAHDAFLGARRRDRQQVYMATFGVSSWKVAGMLPELRLRHSINQADPYWAFGFAQSEVNLMLRRNF